MSLQRSKFEIYRELLTQVHNGHSQPTRIMYSTELPWPTFNQVMKTLISQELLATVEDQVDKSSRAKYRITEKGERLLKYLGKALNSVDVIEEMQVINSS